MTATLDELYQKGYIASDPELDPKPQIRIVNIKKMIEKRREVLIQQGVPSSKAS